MSYAPLSVLCAFAVKIINRKGAKNAKKQNHQIVTAVTSGQAGGDYLCTQKI